MKTSNLIFRAGKIVFVILFCLIAVNVTFGGKYVKGIAYYTTTYKPVTEGVVVIFIIDDSTGEPIVLGTDEVNSIGKYIVNNINTIDTTYAIIYPSDPGTEWDFLPTYHPNELDFVYAYELYPVINLDDIDIYVEEMQQGERILTSNSVILSGKIYDSYNKYFKNAIVYAKYNDEVYSYAKSNSEGLYRLSLPAGAFKIFVNMPGYPLVSKSIDLTNITKEVNLDFLLSKLIKFESRTNIVPPGYELFQNYPNPFNPVTNIKYSIKNNGMVKLQVFNFLGKEVMTLVNEYKNAGVYDVIFDGSNLPSGVYFYKIFSGEYTDTKSMILVK